MAQNKKRKGNKQRTIEDRTNFNDVLIRLIDSVYNLLNSGNIVGAFLIFVFIEIFLVTHKLPPELIDKHLDSLFVFLTDEGFYFIPMSIALAFSIGVNIYQSKIYRKHIHEQAEFRKMIIHGIEKSELKTLKNHHSSGFDIREED